jgi:hypothetical protein
MMHWRVAEVGVDSHPLSVPLTISYSGVDSSLNNSTCLTATEAAFDIIFHG